MPRTITSVRLWWSVFSCLTVVYLLTAHWYGIANVDSTAAAWPAWTYAHTGSFFLDAGPSPLPPNPWFQDTGTHVVSNRMPGVVLAGVPAQILLAPLGTHPLTAATLTAVVVTAVAMANLALLLRRLDMSTPRAMAVTGAVALGTGVWSNAAGELWTHGPDLLWLTCAMLALSSRRYWLVGLALAPAVLTRPHLALVAAVVGVGMSVSHRSLGPALKVGLPSAAAVLALVGWNDIMFGAPSLDGGYGYAVSRATSTSASSHLPFLESAAGTLVSPLRGALIFSPFLLVAAVCAVSELRARAAWPAWCAAGGTLYQLAQWRINAFEGGSGYFSYRLPLELLVLCVPLAVLGYQRLAADSPRLRSVTRCLVGFSLATHTVGAFWHQPLGGRGQVVDAWTTWGLWEAAVSRGTSGTVVAAVLLLCMTTLTWAGPAAWSALQAQARTSQSMARRSPALARLLRLSAAAPS